MLFPSLIASQSTGKTNHPICTTIANTWFNSRIAQKIRQDITTQDTICNVFDNLPDLCNHADLRPTIPPPNGGSWTPEQLSARCTMVGAHSKRCLNNPCNHLNTGECNIQSTQGQCIWITKEMLPKYNAVYKAKGWNLLPGHGCYRNPCNLPGYGKAVDECKEHNSPGLFECTWCYGIGPLKDLGIGCQLTVPTTQAQCAPVNSPEAPQSSVMVSRSNYNCQCSMRFVMCNVIVNSRSSDFYPKIKG